MLKKIVCITLTLVMICSAALAAPSRDLRTMTGKGEDSLRTFVSLIGGAALLRSQTSLDAGETPPQALVEGALLLGLKRVILPRNDLRSMQETLTEAELARCYQDLFATGSYGLPETPTCPCMTRQGNTLVFDFSAMDGDMEGGARIYDVTRQGNTVTVQADLFTAVAYSGETPEDIPEDCLTWEGQMTLTLKKTDDSRLGYQLISFATSEAYTDGAFSEWQQVQSDGYTVSLPAQFSLASSQNGTDTYVSDTGAQLTIQSIADMGSEKLNYYGDRYQEQHPAARLTVEMDLGYFTGEDNGEYTLCYAHDTLDHVYMITMTFPASRQAEYSLYGEIIRNSFSPAGLAVG